jgi:hypothetical protein
LEEAIDAFHRDQSPHETDFRLRPERSRLPLDHRIVYTHRHDIGRRAVCRLRPNPLEKLVTMVFGDEVKAIGLLDYHVGQRAATRNRSQEMKVGGMNANDQRYASLTLYKSPHQPSGKEPVGVQHVGGRRMAERLTVLYAQKLRQLDKTARAAAHVVVHPRPVSECLESRPGKILKKGNNRAPCSLDIFGVMPIARSENREVMASQ